MTVEQLEKYISSEYGVSGEHMWAKYPNYAVFRHPESKKWFAVLMDVPADKLGLPLLAEGKAQTLYVLDVKCDPILVGSFLGEKGFFPAYHMNKEHWISMAIDQIDEEKIKMLLDMSCRLTAPQCKRKKRQ